MAGPETTSPAIDAGADADMTMNDECNGTPKFTPIAICGMACRLPGGITCPGDLWDLLISKGDARSRVPESRYNVSSFYSPTKKPGHVVSEYGYFLDDDLGALDTSYFPMARSELEVLDPQQRLLFEVTKESLDDAGEVGSGARTSASTWAALGTTACAAISRGECPSAVVGGSSIIAGPSLVVDESNQGTMSPDGSCKTFSAQADGYGRGEGVVVLFIKPLRDALRDGNPIRAVIAGAATNSDGKTSGFTLPNAEAQESLIRRTYLVAGIPPSQIAKTGFFECHGTGTQRGDTVETSAIANVFGNTDFLHLGSVKPNLGHGEGVSGLTAVLKAVLSLENGTIAPNIKCLPLNTNIPFAESRLIVPTEAIPWPTEREPRVSVNSFGIGGSNAHVIIEAPKTLAKPSLPPPLDTRKKLPPNAPHLLLYSAQSEQSLKDMIERYSTFLEDSQGTVEISDMAYTLANRRDHLPFRSYTVRSSHQPGITSAPSSQQSSGPPSIAMVFTGQGAQWPQMGRDLFRTSLVFSETIKDLDGHLQALGPDAPDWKLEDELLKPLRSSRVDEAEFSQPLCTAVQIALVHVLQSVGIRPSAVTGHSSGEIAASYAAGGLSAREAIIVAFYRGSVSKQQHKPGAMAAVSLGWKDIERFLIPGVVVACDNSPKSTTLSGDTHLLDAVSAKIKTDLPTATVTRLKVEKAYHSHHMVEVGDEYYRKMFDSGVHGSNVLTPFFSTVVGDSVSEETQSFGPSYWRKNLESPVLFTAAVSRMLDHVLATSDNCVLLEVGPHAALAAPLRQILAVRPMRTTRVSLPYVPIMTRRQNTREGFLMAIGKLWTLGAEIDFCTLMPPRQMLARSTTLSLEPSAQLLERVPSCERVETRGPSPSRPPWRPDPRVFRGRTRMEKSPSFRDGSLASRP
ncbi:polyketide synthase [Apiospora phragmitis]|uniref:Polyketide synthase n=1 Tax=Apiospora phragmitis TaxID=2905665 RepID=A0ABR1VTN3_9PEZI